MKGWPVILSDRKRAQRGSVLSGVLMITAFLAIIAGALMTELSSNFVLSRVVSNRVTAEATLNSAVEVAIDQLQNAPRGTSTSLCLSASASPNGPTATVVGSCAKPAVFPLQPSTSPFKLDGSLFSPSYRRYDYVLGDSAGATSLYSFTDSFPNGHFEWRVPLGGTTTGPPLELIDPSNGEITVLVPIDYPAPTQQGCVSQHCVAMIHAGPIIEVAGTFHCYMQGSAKIATRPAASTGFSAVYFGDQGGGLWAYDSTTSGACPRLAHTNVGGSIVAGPVAFWNFTRSQDEIYVVVNTAGSSKLVHYSYPQGSSAFTPYAPLSLQRTGAVGLGLEPSGLPARMAIAFAGGQMAIARIESNFGMTLPVPWKQVATASLSTPYWSHRSGAPDLIGVGGSDNVLRLLDTNLSPAGSYLAPPAVAISSAPSADAGGDWYFGGADGLLYEVQPTMEFGANFGIAGSTLSRLSSAPIYGPCLAATATGCVYFAKQDGTVYTVPLVDRDVQLRAACTASCAGPHLWVHLRVSSTTYQGSTPQTVHVDGWSYSSS